MATIGEKVKEIPKNLITKVFAPIAKTVGITEEQVVGTKEYNKKVDETVAGSEVLREWEEGETLYSQLFNRLSKDRDFYLGEKTEQWELEPEGSLKLVFNMGGAIIDLFTYILANNPPTVQFVPDSPEPMSQLRADFGETLVRKLLDNAKFPKRFKDGAKQMFSLGLMWPYSFWNSENKDGGEKGTWEISLLNPFTTRLRFAEDDTETILSFITVKRMLPSVIKEKYGYEALPDSEVKNLPRDMEAQDDGMANVFRRYNKDKIVTVVNGRAVRTEIHKLEFLPVRPVNNIIVTNDAFGYSEIHRWRGIAQELNALITAASEIARDLAYPTLLEVNNALGGRKVSKWRGQKVPIRVSDKGEGVKFLLNTAQMAPLLNQIKLLIELLHFVSLMPKAAAGVFESSVTSGFQAKLAMQPSTLTTENRKIDLSLMVKELVKDAIRFLQKYDPKALEIEIDKKKTIKFEDLHLHEMQVIWPENLPIDIAREIQNLILGIQNNLTSAHQAIDRYNALLGLGSPTDTLSYLEQESESAEITPERALKVAEVRAKLAELNNTLNQAGESLGELRGELAGGESPLPGPLEEVRQAKNPVNAARAATSKLPEQRRPTPQGPESVALESTGGRPVTPKGGA